MKLRLLAALIVGAALAAPVASSAGNSLTVNPQEPSVSSGVFFTVATSGNKDFVAVEVTCDNGYGTRIYVTLDSNGEGTSQTIYPPAGSCTATLEFPQGINRFRPLAPTVPFIVKA